MWVVTRVDEHYPAKLRDTLKHQAPTVLFGAGDIQLLRRGGVAVVGSPNIGQPGAGCRKVARRKTTAGGFRGGSGGPSRPERVARRSGTLAWRASVRVLVC